MGCILITQMMWVFFSADKCSHLLPGTFTIIKIICCTWLSKQWQRPLWAQTLGLDNRSTSPPLCRCRHLFCPCYKGLLWSWPFFFVQDNKRYEFVKQTGGEFRSHTDARYSCDTMTCPDPWATEVLRSGFVHLQNTQCLRGKSEGNQMRRLEGPMWNESQK